MTYTVYVKGNRMARVGPLISLIYDLDAGTVTIMSREKNQYAILAFDQMLNRLTEGSLVGGKMRTVIEDTDRTEDVTNQSAAEHVATVYSGAETGNLVAHASFWNVSKLPVREAAEYQECGKPRWSGRFRGRMSIPAVQALAKLFEWNRSYRSFGKGRLWIRCSRYRRDIEA